jgi:signal transduction histidine kinase
MMTNKELLEELTRRLEDVDDSNKVIEKLQMELNQVNKKLTESESLKSHFISNITNEIINPFASILGLSKNILAAEDIDINRIKNMAELIHSEAFELDFQLKNIFTAAHIEAGETVPEYVNTDINLLITSVVNTYKYKAEQKQLKIDFTLDFDKTLKKDTYFNTDPEKLRLILSNLLSNSIKYSNAANSIKIQSFIEDKILKIIVKDYGIGIDKKNLEIIFDRFKRIDSTINSLNTGHGLGLSVTKALIDSLGGEIKIISKLNKGTIFTITIPQVESTGDNGYAVDGNEFIFDNGDEIF